MKLQWTGLALSLLAAACATTKSSNNDIRLAARKCGLEGRIAYQVTGERRLRVSRLDPSVKYEEADCFLAEARRLGFDLGVYFIGNSGPQPR